MIFILVTDKFHITLRIINANELDAFWRNMLSELNMLGERVLGFHKLSPDEKAYYESVFSVLQILDVSPTIIEKAVEIRQAQRIKLGDALIAATALVHDLELNTRNLKDFQNLPDIRLNNPILES